MTTDYSIRRLSDLLPEDGMEAVQQFATRMKAGEFKDKDYLDAHAALREVLRPHAAHFNARGMTDIDYFTLAILHALGQEGTDRFS